MIKNYVRSVIRFTFAGAPAAYFPTVPRRRRQWDGQRENRTMLSQESGGAATSFESSMPVGGYGVASTRLAASADPAATHNSVCASLTARQRDVLSVMMQGKSNKAICRILNLAEPTVKNHVTAIL